MTQKDKLLKKLANHESDRSWSFAELEHVLIICGYSLKRIRGSHHVYGNDERHKELVLPRHGSKIKPVYVKEVRKCLTNEKEAP